MFVKVNEFEIDAPSPLPGPAPAARRTRWPNAVHGLGGFAFLLAWLPMTLLCWAVLGSMILLKLCADAARHAGNALFGPPAR